MKQFLLLSLFFTTVVWCSHQSYQSTPLLNNRDVKLALSEALIKISKRSPDSSFSELGDRYESNDMIVYQRLTHEVYDQLLGAAQKTNSDDYHKFVRQRRVENVVDTVFCCCGQSPKARFKITLRCAQNYENYLS